MARYRVQLKEVINYTMEVEADYEFQADDEARAAWEHSEDPFNEFGGSSEGAKAVTVAKI